MRLLVCGGRDYSDEVYASIVLTALHAERPIAVVIHGGAPGADSLAGWWARNHGIEESRFPVTPAEWKDLGHKAGPVRNRRMLREAKPDLVLAFPGNRGTANMVAIAKRAGVPVRFAYTDEPEPITWSEK